MSVRHGASKSFLRGQQPPFAGGPDLRGRAPVFGGAPARRCEACAYVARMRQSENLIIQKGPHMHVRELVELGTIVATHCGPLVRWADPLAERHVEQYWLASRCRQDRWGHALRNYRLEADSDNPSKAWHEVRPTIEEILGSELLTRTWTAAAAAHDHHHDCQNWEPIARSVLLGHLEARNRAMNVVVYGRGFSMEDGVVLNRLRRRVERWTDMLLGRIMLHHDISDLAFDAKRVREFAADLRAESAQSPNSQVWQLTLASLQAAFQQAFDSASPNVDLNRRIAAGILASLPTDQFDSTGLFKSAWLLRLEHVTGDMQGLIDDLIQPSDPPPRRFFVRR